MDQEEIEKLKANIDLYREEVKTIRALLSQIDLQVDELEKENQFLESELSRRQIQVEEIELYWKNQTEIWQIKIEKNEVLVRETLEKLEKKEEVIGVLREDVENHVKQKEVLSQHVREAQKQVAQITVKETQQNQVGIYKILSN